MNFLDVNDIINIARKMKIDLEEEIIYYWIHSVNKSCNRLEKNDFLSVDEFIKAVLDFHTDGKLIKKDDEYKLDIKAAFNVIDANSSGFIEKEDIIITMEIFNQVFTTFDEILIWKFFNNYKLSKISLEDFESILK